MARALAKVRHLQNRNGRYFARLAVPKELQTIVGKHELLTALGADRALAITNLHEAVAGFQKTLTEARQGIKPTPPPLSVRQAVHAHYDRELALDRAIDLSGKQPREYAKIWSSKKWSDQYLHNLERIAEGTLTFEEIRDGMIEGTIGWAMPPEETPEGPISPLTGTVLAKPRRKKEWFDLAAALARTQMEVIKRSRERNEGNWEGEPSFELLQESPDSPHGVPLKGLLDSYLAMLARSGRGAEAGKRWRPCFRDLIDFLGHDDARKLTKTDMLKWIEHLRETKAEKTIRDVYLGSVKAVMNYAAEIDTLPANPARDVKIRMGRPTRGREKGFTSAEASALLKASQSYQPKPSENPQTREGDKLVAAKRWAPLLCAYTGARIAEMCQLRKEDVREQDGIPYLRLTPDAGSIKTGEYRDAPIHPAVIKAGFLDFVAASAEGPLFYRENPDRKGKTHPSKTVSGRISEWIRTLKVISIDVDPNHAWRHTFKTISREAGIDSVVANAIQGHAERTAGEKYGSVTLKAKQRAILQFPVFQY